MPKSKNTALLKVSLLILFIGVSIYLVRFSPARQYFTADQLGLIMEAAGFWAPLLFVFIYAADICLFLPGTLLTALGDAERLSETPLADACFQPAAGMIIAQKTMAFDFLTEHSVSSGDSYQSSYASAMRLNIEP